MGGVFSNSGTQTKSGRVEERSKLKASRTESTTVDTIQFWPRCTLLLKETKQLLSAYLYEVLCEVVVSYLFPVCATVAELQDIGASTVSMESLLRTVETDSHLCTDGFYTRSFKITVVGIKQWNAFLLKTTHPGFDGNALWTLILCSSYEPHISALREAVPSDEASKLEYFRWTHPINGQMIGIAAIRDLMRLQGPTDCWRLAAMQSMCPKMWPVATRDPVKDVFSTTLLTLTSTNHVEFEAIPRSEFVAVLSKLLPDCDRLGTREYKAKKYRPLEEVRRRFEDFMVWLFPNGGSPQRIEYMRAAVIEICNYPFT